ncbi:hypothetical protein MTP99_004108 [Tenebrio molitor]|nr:hypothetical protein MTP99_004108 [Tenebrio molitor]
MNPGRMNYDYLKLVRVIGSDIYQFKFVKQLLKLTLIAYLILLLLQLYYFFQTPNVEDLIRYGPLFFQMCFVSFAFVILLVKNHLVDDVMSAIELWDISSAGNDVKLRILRESRQINAFVVVNITLIVLCSTSHILSCHNDPEIIFIQVIFDKLCPREANICVFIFKTTMNLGGLVMVAHTYQVIYVTQQVKFQMYLCNAFIEGLSTNFKELEDPIRNNIYQKEIESKLTMIIDRHCVIIRWTNNGLMLMSNLIIPFTICAIIIGISIVLSFLQEVVSWRYYLMAVVALFTISSLITAGQCFQDESENMFLKFTATEWYTWNIRNRKKLVLILINTAQPLRLKFSESFIINFDLLVFICKALYSVLSILVKVKYN